VTATAAAIVPRAARAASLAWPAVLLVFAWQLWIVIANVPAIVAPPPLAVVAELAREPLLYAHAALSTLGVALLGLIAGTLLGVALAVAIWLTPFAAAAMTVPALLVQSTPLIATLPVLARLLGYGEQTVIAAAVLITFLPTFVLVGSGLRSVPAGSAGVFAALGANRRAQLVLLAAPAAVPSVLLALRIAAANSILAALLAEYMIGQSGLGRLFADAQSQFLTSRSWAASLVATVLSVAAYAAARRLERFGKRFTI
jgi:ABC-type nitrate/sulfonate/bicarbonate transport system permease component